MKELATFSNKQTMSSREIASLTEKEHKHVLSDIRRILAEADISSAQFEAVYKDQQLINRPCFLLPRRECDLVVSGYSVKYRLAIIDRWQELESKQLTIPTTYAEALRLAADEHEGRLLAEEAARIAVETKAQISDSKTATALNTASQAAKKVQKLEAELAIVNENSEASALYKTIKAMSLQHPGRKFNKTRLDSASVVLGLRVNKIVRPDHKIESLYHRDVWLEAYRVAI
jgi:phage regulator Rha-like protein